MLLYEGFEVFFVAGLFKAFVSWHLVHYLPNP